ncbi:MAG: branched-chain amino acid ABC transporter permease [Saccharofermentanales bacterium]|jgi:branched-chain amino acid transport system permease protein
MNDQLKIMLFSKKNLFPLGLLVIALFLPLINDSNYFMSVMVNCLLFGSIGFAWNILAGYGGQISLCHSGFMAIGAYTCFILYNNYGVSTLLSMPVGMFICYLFATVMGKVTLRYRGPFFTISTVVFIELLRVMLLYFKELTKGASGILISFKQEEPWNLIFRSGVPYYYIALVILVLSITVTWLFINSKTGYYLRTIKGDQDAASSLGIDISRIKLVSFQLSAVMTSVVGAIYALFMTYIEPGTICSTDLSIKICAIVIIGGMGSFWGPLVGAFILIPLSEVALKVFPNGGAQLFYGLGLIIIMLLIPGGIVSVFRDKVFVWVRKCFFGKTAIKQGGNQV